jgi:hypothetical protein
MMDVLNMSTNQHVQECAHVVCKLILRVLASPAKFAELFDQPQSNSIIAPIEHKFTFPTKSIVTNEARFYRLLTEKTCEVTHHLMNHLLVVTPMGDMDFSDDDDDDDDDDGFKDMQKYAIVNPLPGGIAFLHTNVECVPLNDTLTLK